MDAFEAMDSSRCQLAPRCQVSKDVGCPIICIMKAFIFVLVAIFVVYLPLGDPEVNCKPEERQSKNQRLAMCCICDLYVLAVKLSHKLLNFLEFLLSLLMDLLYELKIKFYNFLEKLDAKDLCRSVCCFDENEDPNKKEHRQRSCRCVRSKCSRAK